MTELFFSDAWFLEIWRIIDLTRYTVAIGLILLLLKMWARINPNVPTDKIIDLIKRAMVRR